MSLRLAFKLGIGTLRSRPTLTLLAVGLLALGTAILGGLFGSVYLLQSLESEFTSGLNVEIELAAGLADSTREAVMDLAEAWPGAEFVQYVPPEVTMQEIQQETGEDLITLFGGNPFPPMVRVRFSHASTLLLDSLTHAAHSWPGVTTVSYPRRLWSDISRLIDRLTGGVSYAAGLFTMIPIVLVGLCLRAQVRNRAETWSFLNLLGMSRRTYGLALLAQESGVGLVGGLLACCVLWALTVSYSYLFLRVVQFPLWFYVLVVLGGIMLAVLAGLLSPRKIRG